MRLYERCVYKTEIADIKDLIDCYRYAYKEGAL